jgi:hypothetical protein
MGGGKGVRAARGWSVSWAEEGRERPWQRYDVKWKRRDKEKGQTVVGTQSKKLQDRIADANLPRNFAPFL